MKPVVSIDREQDPGHRDDHGDWGHTPFENVFKTDFYDKNVDHVECNNGKNRRKEREDDSHVAKLSSLLNHSRQTQLRPLRRESGHEQGSKQDSGDCGNGRAQEI